MDDDEAMRNVIKCVMKRLDYNAVFAKNGEETIKAYNASRKNSDPVKVILMDLNIDEGLDGRETIKQLLNIDPDVKIIATSGDIYDPVMENCDKFGFVAAISKPYSINTLKKTLDEVIRNIKDV